MVNLKPFKIPFVLFLFLCLFTPGGPAYCQEGLSSEKGPNSPQVAALKLTSELPEKEKEESEESAQVCPGSREGQAFSIEKGFTESQLKAVKLAINTINKDIPVEGEKGSTWRVYTQPILKRKNLYLLRDENGKILAYAAMRDEGSYLSWIAVRSGFQGKEKGGLARRLMQRILEEWGQITLDVRANNAKAVKFYENLSDITTVEKKEGFDYKNGDKGLVFIIGLPKS